MRFNAISPFVWREINQAIKDKLGVSSQVYTYRGMHHALFEICLGLQMRFGHKRKMVVQSGLGDHLAQTELELAKLGVRFKSFFEEDIQKEEKSCLAYIHDLDDALTGELYDHIETLKQIASTKIYRVHLAHHLFHIRKMFVKSLSEYDIIIVSLNQDYALVFTGEKITLPVLTVGQLAWSMERDGQVILDLIDKDVKLRQSEVVNFETALPAGIKPWFVEQPAKRIYDRSVVVFERHDGSAMMQLLEQTMQLEKQALGAHQSFEAASLCRWQNDSWFNQAETLAHTKNDLRGMLSIDAELLNPQFNQIFMTCFEALNKLSN